MEIKVIFCSGSSVVSKLIQWATEEPISHVALLVNDTWVVHSNLRGVHAQYFESFITDYRIWHITDPVETSTPIQEALKDKSFRGYDVLALLYLASRYIIKKLFRVKLPKVNLWQATGLYLCTEWVTYILEGEEDSMITPYQLYQLLEGKK